MSEDEKRTTPERESSAEDAPIDPDNAMDRGMRTSLGAYLAVLSALLLYLFGKFWPSDLRGTAAAAADIGNLFWWEGVRVSGEARLLVLVMCAGAMGSMLHAVQSFVTFHGNQRLAKSWLPWYLLRPFVGALLALIFYLLIRGGLVAGVPPSGDGQFPVNVIGIVSAAALVGLFSDLASLKLKEVFTTMFASSVKRADALPGGTTEGAKPEISGTDPASVAKGKPVTLKIHGMNFVQKSKVTVDGKPRETNFVSAEELTAALQATDVAGDQPPAIRVANPKGQGGESEPWKKLNVVSS